jgi:uncharacterized C2H2 Zn-finger protein
LSEQKPEEKPAQEAEQIFKCPVCGRKYKTEVRLKEHMDEKHKKPEEKSQERRFEGIFPQIREPSEIMRDILKSYGLSDEFIEWVTRYVDRKGGLDPGWLLSMLTTARTGRRLTDAEAYLIVDEVVSEIEKERVKAEQQKRPWSFFVTGYTTRTQAPTYMPYPTQYPTTTPYTPPYTTQPPSQYPTITPPPLTEERIKAMMHELLEEKRRKDELEELRDKQASLEREVDKKIMDLRKEVADTLSKITDEIVEKIKPLIPQQKAEGGIDKKDLELMKSELEKTYISKIHDIEKQRTEETIKTLKEELADIKSKVGKPTVAPEGWSSDAYRAFTEVGTRAMDTLERVASGRKPLETLFKIIVQPIQPPQTKEVKSDLASKIEKEGGLVE